MNFVPSTIPICVNDAGVLTYEVNKGKYCIAFDIAPYDSRPVIDESWYDGSHFDLRDPKERKRLQRDLLKLMEAAAADWAQEMCG